MTLQDLFKRYGRWLIAVSVAALTACGGGGSSSKASGGSDAISAPVISGANVQAVRVGSGPAGAPRVANVLYTKVRVCAPGSTSNCQTIDHVLVDTGSTGLRLLKSVVNVSLSNALPRNSLYNCTQFLDGSYMWGPVVKADVYMGGEKLNGVKASNLPMQLVITSNESPTAPLTCQGSAPEPDSNDSVSKLGANGILGIGTDPYDCGTDCANSSGNNVYYKENGLTATSSIAALSDQVRHPVSLFETDNNGTLIELPSLPGGLAPQVNGWLIFGIGTRDNNQRGQATVFEGASRYSYAQFKTDYNAKSDLQGFIDSGSNGLFFGSRPVGAFEFCPDDPFSELPSPWYCPSTNSTLPVTNRSLIPGDPSSTVSLQITNATALFATPGAYAYSTLAGEIGQSDLFDFGLPFFFGRKVFTAISDESGNGAYVAY